MPSINATLINSNPYEITPDIWESICFDVYDLCVAYSPVDTGAFQSAWEIVQLSDDIFEISNPSEYASFLEDGWSEQAPDGCLEKAINRLPSIIRGYLGRKPKGQVTVSIEVPDYEPNSE